MGDVTPEDLEDAANVLHYCAPADWPDAPDWHREQDRRSRESRLRVAHLLEEMAAKIREGRGDGE